MMPVEAPTGAIILAGGLGTRLRSAVSDVPKPMAPINGRPFLEYLMTYWSSHGIRHFVLSVGYMSDCIKEYFGDKYRGCKISYVEEDEPLGTGGGIKKTILGTNWAQSHIVLINGDTWYEINLDMMVSVASISNKPVTMALKPMECNDRYGGVHVKEGRVLEFNVKSAKPCLINGGCYLLDLCWISSLLTDYPDKFSFERDFLVPLAARGLVAASIQDGVFIDIGVPRDYLAALDLILERVHEIQ